MGHATGPVRGGAGGERWGRARVRRYKRTILCGVKGETGRSEKSRRCRCGRCFFRFRHRRTPHQSSAPHQVLQRRSSAPSVRQPQAVQYIVISSRLPHQCCVYATRLRYSRTNCSAPFATVPRRLSLVASCVLSWSSPAVPFSILCATKV